MPTNLQEDIVHDTSEPTPARKGRKRKPKLDKTFRDLETQLQARRDVREAIVNMVEQALAHATTPQV